MAEVFLVELLNKLLCLCWLLDNVMNRPGNLSGNVIKQKQIAHFNCRAWICKGLQPLGRIGCIFLLHDMPGHRQSNNAFEPPEIGLGGEGTVACRMLTK